MGSMLKVVPFGVLICVGFKLTTRYVRGKRPNRYTARLSK